MTPNYSICLGTAGWGVWHSPDAGASWTRHRAPFPLNTRIQALVAHPTRPHTLYAAGDAGLFVTDDGGAAWEPIGARGDLPTIWSLAIDPSNPDTLFAGTRPAGVYRSHDGGRSWTRLNVPIAPECAIGVPFVTALAVDPDEPESSGPASKSMACSAAWTVATPGFGSTTAFTTSTCTTW